jgi:hypothetical protein
MSLASLSQEIQNEIKVFQENKVSHSAEQFKNSPSRMEIIARYLPQLKLLFEKCKNLDKHEKAELINTFVKDANWIETSCNDLARVQLYNLVGNSAYDRNTFITTITSLTESSNIETNGRKEYLKNGWLPPIGCEWEATPEYFHHNRFHVPARYDLAFKKKHPLGLKNKNEKIFFEYFKGIIKNLGIEHNYENLLGHKYLEFKTRPMYCATTAANFLIQVSEMQEFRTEQIGAKNSMKPITMHISLENLLGIDFYNYPTKILNNLSNIIALGYTSPERIEQRHMNDSIKTDYAEPMISEIDKSKRYSSHQGRIEIRPSDWNGENTLEIIKSIQYLTAAMYGHISEEIRNDIEEQKQDMHFGYTPTFETNESRLINYPQNISEELSSVWKQLEINLNKILSKYLIKDREFDDDDKKTKLSRMLNNNPQISLDIRNLVKEYIPKIKKIIELS